MAAQYSGARAAVKPIYDEVMGQVTRFGEDVEVSPKKTYVSLRRAKQFALLQPAASRLDVGIKLTDTAPTARLEPSGSFNAMVTHRVRVSSIDEVDTELIGWLREAYERAEWWAEIRSTLRDRRAGLPSSSGLDLNNSGLPAAVAPRGAGPRVSTMAGSCYCLSC